MPERDDSGLDINTGQSTAEFDRMLRSSLETYADPGPDSYLAQRVLARIAVEGERRHKRGMIRWAIALPVAACLVIALVLAVSWSLHNSADRTNQARVTVPNSAEADWGGSIANLPSVPAPQNEVPRPVRHLPRVAAAATAERLPKLDVFPAPQPLTREEKELMAYVARAPQAERKSLVEEQKQIDAPLSIAALEIQPLEPPDTGGN